MKYIFDFPIEGKGFKNDILPQDLRTAGVNVLAQVAVDDPHQALKILVNCLNKNKPFKFRVEL